MRLRRAAQVGGLLRFIIAITLLVGAAALSLRPAPLAAAAILAAAALLLAERRALVAALRALTATLEAAPPEHKLEVGGGAWGELCHAFNRLLQQRRAERQLRPLLPSLPFEGAARLAELDLPPEGLISEVTVLALGQPPAAGGAVAQLQAAAAAALQQAGRYDALLTRSGESLLLIFGPLRPGAGPAANLADAYQAALALAASTTTPLPRLALARGQARALILPGLGLCLLGTPLDNALALLGRAESAQLVCAEEPYLALRRVGVATAQPIIHLPAAADHPAAFVTTLPKA
jgi:hypothetical protein